MADPQRNGLAERDVEQAIVALKKGAYLLKYGRRGKPKFCPFRLSNPIFQRYPRPEKEYQSFSLIYGDRSLDLICKDKDEAEVWFVGLKGLISRGNYRKWRSEIRDDSISSESPHSRARRISPSLSSSDPGDTQQTQVTFENIPQSGLGKAFSDVISYTASTKSFTQAESVASSLSSLSSGGVDNSNGRTSASENFRVSLSSAVSSSSQGSGHDDFDALGDVFMWGEGIGDGIMGAGVHRVGSSSSTKIDALLPKALESTVVLDVHSIACGGKHAVLVTKKGEVFSWGEECGSRLGHGVEVDVSHPKLIDALCGMNIELVACGEYHSCAVTLSGDLYTWGDGTHNSGLLGHGSEASHWIPKKVSGPMEGMHVSYVACGPWHTAVVTSAGQLFTFGDGTFGALGHGDHSSMSIPREVEALRGQRTMRVACGVWHTAAVVELMIASSSSESSGSSSSGKLFTWGDGDKGRLGHGDKEPRLVPQSVTALINESFCQVACGHNLTVALTTSGRVYTMGSAVYGQLGSPVADGKIPTLVEGKIANSFVEEVACGSYHVAVLTSKTEVYTWGKGTNGQLGHGDNDHRNTPTLVDFLKDKQVKNVVCGLNFTAAISLHKWVSCADHSICSGCHNQFGFRRKRHNCYNCGLVFCNTCSSRKSLKASLAPNMNKPYRVCDDCFTKLKKAMESGSVLRIPKARSSNILQKSNEIAERDTMGPRVQGQLSRLSSVDSFSRAESKHYKCDTKLEFNDGRVSPHLNGNVQRGSFHSSKLSNSLFGGSRKIFSASRPGSRIVSRATSPVSGKSSPPQSAMLAASLAVVRSPEAMDDDPKHTNDSLSREIINLRAQVENLTGKSQILEAELERSSRKLKEVTAVAEGEAEKCKAAKEVIKSLTAQLKEMAERVPEEHISISKSGSSARQTPNIVDMFSNENHSTSLTSPESESNGSSVNPILSSGTKAQTEKSEWVVQDEPGVYLTLSSLAGGGNELRRVRFSRKRFTEEQAEVWWAENGSKVCERHDIRSVE
ncbi:PH, RCC1 and FYVE domains-containing protein 1-like isoform X2 [Vitis riparia]|uniref:PH, RCC1 and FYVE domains-containing protein 1-like isoform X2 n=1 Tax=Vitis riparia TaxID=96939 RepID=UPI00155A0FE3|nr:PH, RCC1 and FYVE domains-containing protein 1-like isoform X2 [Vitis riparia]